MNNPVAVRFDALLEHAQSISKKSGAPLWKTVFFDLTTVEDIQSYLQYGFDANCLEPSEWLSIFMREAFGSQLIPVFLNHGRDIHAIWPTKTVCNWIDPDLPPFSCSDLGYILYNQFALSWKKYASQGDIDLNVVCACNDEHQLAPLDLALLLGHVNSAYNILSAGGRLHSRTTFEKSVRKFLTTIPLIKNDFGVKSLWVALKDFDHSVCERILQEVLDPLSLPERNLIDQRLNAPLNFSKKAPSAPLPPPIPTETKDFSYTLRQTFVSNLLTSYKPKDKEMAQEIFGRLSEPLNLLDPKNYMVLAAQGVCKVGNTDALRFLVKQGLKGEQPILIDPGKKVSEPFVHTWFRFSNWQTPSQSQWEATRTLLNNSACVSSTDDEGNTLVYKIIHQRHYYNTLNLIQFTRVMDFLLPYGIDLQIRNAKGQTVSESVGDHHPFSAYLKRLESMQLKQTLIHSVDDTLATSKHATSKRRL